MDVFAGKLIKLIYEASKKIHEKWQESMFLLTLLFQHAHHCWVSVKTILANVRMYNFLFTPTTL